MATAVAAWLCVNRHGPNQHDPRQHEFRQRHDTRLVVHLKVTTGTSTRIARWGKRLYLVFRCQSVASLLHTQPL